MTTPTTAIAITTTPTTAPVPAAGITTTALTREFRFNGLKLDDPAPALSAEQVRDLYVAMYPELGAASIEGPSVEGGRLIWTYKVGLGDKG